MGKHYKISKITSDHVVDFAAEELKKYLRMMMPRCGEIDIIYDPDATDGFRLGRMQDFALDVSEADDASLDDILHIDTDDNGGILAGSNPRSVLLAVYRYLTLNGCRWLFPGIDGEIIPVKSIEPVYYHKMADCRYRGQCNEGAEYQPNMIEAIDFTPKLGMNVFMLEFEYPSVYYDRYYKHQHNTANREEEPITPETILQWKRQCETEIAKRGLQFHDMGHGWTVKAFNMSTEDAWSDCAEERIPPESRELIALYKGERKLFKNRLTWTNFCMSNPRARANAVKSIADYAEFSTNVDYLHVWLADMSNNHCECDECRKKTPSDWYVVLMNEVDRELTKRGLDTHVVMICYVDTTWAPVIERLENPSRFSLLVAAITRNYTEAVSGEIPLDSIALPPYELNKSPMPSSVDTYIAHAKQWLKCAPIPSFVYEYHFWRAQYRDVGMLDIARVIHKDILGYRANGLMGIIEDGSQRSFFPNGFAFYVYASTLFDTSLRFEDLVEDYFSHAYGEDWKEVVAFLERVETILPATYLNGKCSTDALRGPLYCPAIADACRDLVACTEHFAEFVRTHRRMPLRAQTVAYKLLHYYLLYLQGIAPSISLKAVGEHTKAKDTLTEFFNDFGRYELEIERWYDHCLCSIALHDVIDKLPQGFAL